MERRKCRKCGRYLYNDESPEEHLEVCGGVDDSEAEGLSADDLIDIEDDDIDWEPYQWT